MAFVNLKAKNEKLDKNMEKNQVKGDLLQTLVFQLKHTLQYTCEGELSCNRKRLIVSPYLEALFNDRPSANVSYRTNNIHL